MSEAAKPDPSADQTANPGATLVQDQTDLVTKGTTEEAPKEETKAAPTVTEQVTSTATAVKDNVFSMFGGGPKKEKKEEEDDVDEPSGATKKPAVDVCHTVSELDTFADPY
jgi:Ran-binding protein 1